MGVKEGENSLSFKPLCIYRRAYFLNGKRRYIKRSVFKFTGADKEARALKQYIVSDMKFVCGKFSLAV